MNSPPPSWKKHLRAGLAISMVAGLALCAATVLNLSISAPLVGPALVCLPLIAWIAEVL